MTKKFVFSALRVAISLGLIAFLFWMMRGNIGEVGLAIKKADRIMLFCGFALFVCAYALLGVRLNSILAAQDLNITLRETTYLSYIGQFFSNFLPTSIGGDVVKAYYISKKTGKKMISIACVLFDRILGTITLFLMVLITSFFIKNAFLNKTIEMFLMITLSISFVVLVILFSRRIARKTVGPIVKKFSNWEKMKSAYYVIYNYKKHPFLLGKAVLISISLQLVFFVAVYLLTKSLNATVPLIRVLLLMPIISTVSLAPSINGLGIRESSFVFFFGPFMGKEAAFALSILWLGLNFAASLIGGFIYLFSNRYRVKLKEVSLDR